MCVSVCVLRAKGFAMLAALTASVTLTAGWTSDTCRKYFCALVVSLRLFISLFLVSTHPFLCVAFLSQAQSFPDSQAKSEERGESAGTETKVRHRQTEMESEIQRGTDRDRWMRGGIMSPYPDAAAAG